MSEKLTVVIPELGDFESVPVIEILVSEGEQVEAETPLITLESDKATMEMSCCLRPKSDWVGAS